MSVENSLQLCYKFNDVYNFEVLMEKVPEPNHDK